MNRFKIAIKLAKQGYKIIDWKFDSDENEYPITKKSIIKDNPVPSLNRISIGKEFSTDNALVLDDKEYLIESPAWSLLSILKQSKSHEELSSKIMKFIHREYNNNDNLINGVENNKDNL